MFAHSAVLGWVIPWLFNQVSSSAHLQLDLDPYTGSFHGGEEGKRTLNYCHPALGHALQMGHQSAWLKGQQRGSCFSFSMSGTLSADQTQVPTQGVMSRPQKHGTSSMGQIPQGCVGWAWLHGTQLRESKNQPCKGKYNM